MSPARTTGAHRRTGTASVAAVLDQLRQARAERDQLAAQQAPIVAELDTLRAMLVEAWQQAEIDAAAAYADGKSDEAAAVTRELAELYGSDGGRVVTVPCQPWPDTQDAALLARRWGSPLENCPRHGADCTGRLHFADPRPGDYMGGPVVWPSPAGVDVEAVAS